MKTDKINQRVPENENKPRDNFPERKETFINRTQDQSNDDVPDFLNYPPEEDITRQAKKESIDVEKITRSGQVDSVTNRQESPQMPDMQNDDVGPADVTREDLLNLEATEGMKPISKLEFLDEENDLDVPGAELDDQNEELGEEDEENNYYSLGGERHEGLEEDQG